MPGFADIYGQDQIKEHLQMAIAADKVSHAYMLCGEKYSGKEYIARIFAAALLCDDETDKPCGKCHSCKQAFTDNNPDIIIVTHEKPNIIGVDDIRFGVNETVSVKPYAGKKKIYIIPEAEKMNQQAQNAILKTLEEPPEYTVIMLLTTNPDDMLSTIRSRCIELPMKPVNDSIIKKYLMEEVCIPDYKADVCVAFARGNLGKARLLATNDDFDKIREEAVNLMKYMPDMEISELVMQAKKMTNYKVDISDFLDLLVVYFRDALMFKATMDANHLIFKEELTYIKKVADLAGYEDINECVEAIETAKRRLTANVNFELTMELLFLNIKEKLV